MRWSRKRKLFLSILSVLILLLFLGYYRLGGLNPVKVETATVDGYHLAGRYFTGSYKGDTTRMFFNEMRDLVKTGTIEGHPVIIYDREPEGSRGISTGFIGILTDEAVTYGDLQTREIDASSCIRVTKDAHISVMPNPGKIEKLIRAFAGEHGLEMKDFNIEIYHPDNRLVIERPLL